MRQPSTVLAHLASASSAISTPRAPLSPSTTTSALTPASFAAMSPLAPVSVASGDESERLAAAQLPSAAGLDQLDPIKRLAHDVVEHKSTNEAPSIP